MIVVSRRFYYFDEKDKRVFQTFIIKNGITRTDFAKMCNISPTLLTLLFNGKRSITKDVAQAFTKNGFKVEIGE